MAALFKLKRSAVAAKIPTTSDFVVGEIAGNTYDGRLYLRCNNGSDFVKEIGAVTSQKGIIFADVSGLAAIDSFEYDAYVKAFEQGAGQSITAFVHVPTSYIASTQINLRIGHYTPGVTANFKFRTVTTLIRKNTDAINSTTNQYTSTNSDQAISATANRYQEVVYDLTNSTGQINSVAVSAGDIIKVTLSRVATTGTDDTNDVRVIPGSAEVLYS